MDKMGMTLLVLQMYFILRVILCLNKFIFTHLFSFFSEAHLIYST